MYYVGGPAHPAPAIIPNPGPELALFGVIALSLGASATC